MDRGVTRRGPHVQRLRFAEHPPEILERRERHRRLVAPAQPRTCHRVEHPLGQQDARALRIRDANAPKEFAAAVGAHDKRLPVKRMPGIGHHADIGPPRIMLWG